MSASLDDLELLDWDNLDRLSRAKVLWRTSELAQGALADMLVKAAAEATFAVPHLETSAVVARTANLDSFSWLLVLLPLTKRRVEVFIEDGSELPTDPFVRAGAEPFRQVSSSPQTDLVVDLVGSGPTIWNDMSVPSRLVVSATDTPDVLASQLSMRVRP